MQLSYQALQSLFEVYQAQLLELSYIVPKLDAIIARLYDHRGIETLVPYIFESEECLALWLEIRESLFVGQSRRKTITLLKSMGIPVTAVETFLPAEGDSPGTSAAGSSKAAASSKAASPSEQDDEQDENYLEENEPEGASDNDSSGSFRDAS